MARLKNRLAQAGLALMLVCGGLVASASQAQVDPFGTPSVPNITMNVKRPRVVVLLHGVTPEPDQARDEGINTSLHPRHYWGMNLIQGIMGYTGQATFRSILPQQTPRANPRDNVSDYFLRLKTSPYLDWDPIAYQRTASRELAPVVFPLAGVTGDLTAIETNQAEIKSYVRLMSGSNNNPFTSVMVTYRDGSKHLMPQTGDAIDQIYLTYLSVFGHLAADRQPQIYLVGHSFGGVVTRAILANPTGADLFGNVLTEQQRTRADFIRNRTVHVTTLSTPHRGTLISDPAGDVARAIRTGGIAAVDAIMDSGVLRFLNLDVLLVGEVRSAVETALDAVAGERECLEDLFRMDEYNNGILNPNTAKRANGSVVPIYTITGRAPGSTHFERTRAPVIIGGVYNPYSILDLISGPDLGTVGHRDQNNFLAKRSLALFLIEGVLHDEGYGKEGKKPWGTAAIAEADRVKSPYQGVGPANPRPVNAGVVLSGALVGRVINHGLEAKMYRWGTDGESDNDGFLSFDSGHGRGLAGTNWYRLYNRLKYGVMMPWDLDNHGSIMFNPGLGMYFQNEMLRKAGPNVAGNSRLSRYPGQNFAPIESHNVSVEVVQVHDVFNSLDVTDQADFAIDVRIGHETTSKVAAKDRRTVGFGSFTANNLPNSVVPIRITVIERDRDFPVTPDDVCAISPVWGREDLYLYYDTRTGKVSGDVNAEAGDLIEAQGYTEINRVRIRLKVTGN